MTSNQVQVQRKTLWFLGFEIYDLGNEEYALSHGGSDKGVQTIVFYPKQRRTFDFTNSTQV
jgi:hypothetical protein